MISNIQVASAEGLRSRTRWTRTVDYDPNGAPNLVSLRRAQFYLLDHTHPFPSQNGPASRRKVLSSKI
jgi:hypothetical protein